MTADELTMAIGLSLNEIDVLWSALNGDEIVDSDELIRRRLIGRLYALRAAMDDRIARVRAEEEERERDRAARGI